MVRSKPEIETSEVKVCKEDSRLADLRYTKAEAGTFWKSTRPTAPTHHSRPLKSKHVADCFGVL